MTRKNLQALDRPPNVNVRPHDQDHLKNVEDLDQKVHRQIIEIEIIKDRNIDYLEGTRKRKKLKFVNNICWESVPSLQNDVPILTMLIRQKLWNCVNFIY